jgi:hypothetical protein
MTNTVSSLKYNGFFHDLHKEYPIPIIRQALLAHWLQTNELSDYPIDALSIPNNLFAPLDSHKTTLLNALRGVLPSFSLKQLETSLEQLIDASDKRRTGTVLTPLFIIDYLVKTAVRFYVNSSSRVPTICDPACGYAGFLVAATNHLCAEYSISIKKALLEHIYGFDINQDAVAIAKIILALYMLKAGDDPRGLSFNIHCIDTLCEDALHLIRTRDGVSGYDVIVTNPPYIKLQNLTPDYRQVLQRKYPQFSSGSFSTAMLFLIAGYRLLSETGCLAYITQNNIFTSLAAREIRRFLGENECVRRIIDFGHARIFDNASAYTCLIFISRQRSPTFEYGRIYRDVNAISLEETKLSYIEHKTLNPTKWRLVTTEHRDNIRKLESIGPPLGSVCTLRVGFATLRDKAYFVRAKDQSVIGELPNGDYCTIESAATRPAIKIAEFESEEGLKTNTRRVIFPYEKIHGKCRPLSEDEFSSRYPRCYEYLLGWRQLLATRDKGKRAIDPWYAWGRTQCLEAPGPKLLTKTFSGHPNFFYDDTDSLFCNGYAVFNKQCDRALFERSYPLRVLQVILNSAIMDYYVRLTSFQIEGDYQCYQKNFIERFSIVFLSKNEMDDLLKMDIEDRDRFLCRKYSLDYETVQSVLNERTIALMPSQMRINDVRRKAIGRNLCIPIRHSTISNNPH